MTAALASFRRVYLPEIVKNDTMYSGRPSRYHGEQNANLAETWLLPDVKGKTKLVLVDALRPLCDKGPQPDPRYLWDYRGLIASTDPVAADAVGLQILLAKRRELRGEDWPLSPPPLCVTVADERYGLGTSRMDEIRIERVGWMAEALVCPPRSAPTIHPTLGLPDDRSSPCDRHLLLDGPRETVADLPASRDRLLLTVARVDADEDPPYGRAVGASAFLVHVGTAPERLHPRGHVVRLDLPGFQRDRIELALTHPGRAGRIGIRRGG